jgi:3-keto-5-aminohexanoate cleavage enzyme
MTPLMIEAALNGATPKSRQPHTPKTPAEIAADALACLEAGAGVVHSHIDGYGDTGDVASEAYWAGWAPVLEARPDAILYATVAGGKSPEDRFGHYRTLARRGMRMGALDPGSVNLATHGEDGLPGKTSFVYQTSYKDIAWLTDLLAAERLGPSIAVYEPGFLRATLAYHRAGKLPAGAFVKFYFGGAYNMIDGQKSDVTFGLPPTEKALEAYLEMMEGCDLPWAVTILGGCVTETGLTRLAIERGGHVRVGLEDYAGPRTPSNVELVEEVVAIAKACGRPVATSAETAQLLGLPA